MHGVHGYPSYQFRDVCAWTSLTARAAGIAGGRGHMTVTLRATHLSSPLDNARRGGPAGRSDPIHTTLDGNVSTRSTQNGRLTFSQQLPKNSTGLTQPRRFTPEPPVCQLTRQNSNVNHVKLEADRQA